MAEKTAGVDMVWRN